MGIVQGLTEFLPVSSSGHLALLNALFGFGGEEGLSLTIVLHAGSLTAIIAVYFRELLKFLKPGCMHLIFMLILATIPAGAVGVIIHHFKWDERFFGNMLFVGGGFLVTGALLRLTGRAKLIARSEGANGTELEKISLRQALIVGFAQMFAIAPGISRSGSTISAGVLCGIKREAAATFSFLLAIPVIGGAVLVKLIGAAKNADTGNMSWCVLALGFAVSAAVSFAALTLLLKIVRRGKLCYFSWYMLTLGLAVTLWQMFKAMK
jgi:undecaprenyl-diphosphatase